MIEAHTIDTDEANNIIALRNIMQQPDGATFLTWILGLCETEADPFVPEPMELSHRLGQQSVGRKIKTAISAIDLHYYANLQEKQRHA